MRDSASMSFLFDRIKTQNEVRQLSVPPKATFTESPSTEAEFSGVYETIPDSANRLLAYFWQRTGQPHPTILEKQTKNNQSDDDGGRVGTSNKWWRRGESNP